MSEIGFGFHKICVIDFHGRGDPAPTMWLCYWFSWAGGPRPYDVVFYNLDVEFHLGPCCLRDLVILINRFPAVLHWDGKIARDTLMEVDPPIHFRIV